MGSGPGHFEAGGVKAGFTPDGSLPLRDQKPWFQARPGAQDLQGLPKDGPSPRLRFRAKMAAPFALKQPSTQHYEKFSKLHAAKTPPWPDYTV